ncbi:hypothetical protein J5N97_004620 [Dioscorea zingiberensis]|uniref:Uncharacterized protein n=1 Tax=Dioscorea zingiberensis TaxID=325984 RepID=A0A9D5D7N2_9LILI|nr:hypothetical protein J5N97_004620 [Dioscorea zingiberensis]
MVARRSMLSRWQDGYSLGGSVWFCIVCQQSLVGGQLCLNVSGDVRAHLRDRHTLSFLFALCNHGVEPEALAAPSVTFPSPPNHRCSSSSHQSLALGPFSQTIATATAFSILYGAPNPWIQKEGGGGG